MEVVLIRPTGYCLGVTSAIRLGLQAKSEHPDETIFMLGLLVHNEDAVAYMRSLGFEILDERKAPLEEQLLGLKDGSIVLFSAHGHPEAFDEIAKRKNLIVYDATCRYVKENLDYARAHEGLGIVYIGAKGHLEAESFKENAPFAGFYDVKSKALLSSPTIEASIALTQTTLSEEDIDSALEDLRKRYPNIKLEKGRCVATSSRQEALKKELEKGVDAAFIIGSELSSNTKKLRDIAQSFGVKTFMALNLEALKKLDLPSYSKVILASGASTSIEEVRRCQDYLESFSS